MSIKLKRSTKEYGGGSGSTFFESDLFRVMTWRLAGGIKTVIECKLSNHEVGFDGTHGFNSDDLCMEQLNVSEIIDMIEQQKMIAFKKGKAAKVKELLACLS